MRPGLLVVALAVSTVCGILLVRQHFQEQAAQARDDEVLRPYRELRAKNERELAAFKAEQAAYLKHEEERIQAIVDNFDLRLRVAEQLYDEDVRIYGKEEADRRQRAGVYLKAALGGE